MNRIILSLLALLLVFCGFTNYGLNGIINVPVILGLLLLAAMALDMCINRYMLRFSWFDAAFIFVFSIIGFANYGLRGPQYINLNHLFAICFCYFVFYYLPYQIFERFQVRLDKILQWIIVGMFLVSMLGSTEAAWQYLSGSQTGFFPSLTYIKVNGATFNLLGHDLYRIRGAQDEPNAFMLYFGTLLPLAVYYFTSLKRKLKPAFSLILAGYVSWVVFFAFSSGWFISTLAAGLIYAAMLLFKTRGKMTKGFKKAAAAVIVIYGIGFSFINGMVKDIVLKFSKDYNQLPDARFNRWYVVLSYWFNNLSILNLLFGLGPGFISETEMIGPGAGVLNLYIKLGVEWGLIGLAVFISLLFHHLYLAAKARHGMQGWLVFSMLYIMVYYLCSDNFYYPVLWILLAVIRYTCQKKDLAKGEWL